MQPPPVLIFKDGKSAFEYTCRYGQTRITRRQGIVALVMDATQEAGTEVAVKIRNDGTQVCLVKVASQDGGFTVVSETVGSGDLLTPGDVVVWVPLSYRWFLKRVFSDKRQRWIWTHTGQACTGVPA